MQNFILTFLFYTEQIVLKFMLFLHLVMQQNLYFTPVAMCKLLCIAMRKIILFAHLTTCITLFTFYTSRCITLFTFYATRCVKFYVLRCVKIFFFAYGGGVNFCDPRGVKVKFLPPLSYLSD